MGTLTKSLNFNDLHVQRCMVLAYFDSVWPTKSLI